MATFQDSTPGPNANPPSTAKDPPVALRPKVTKQPPVSTSKSRAKPSTEEVKRALPSGEKTCSYSSHKIHKVGIMDMIYHRIDDITP